MVSLNSPVAVVANDAGAANLIIGWLKDETDLLIKVCVSGPAIALFKTQFPNVENSTLLEALDGASTLLSGTSGVCELEHNARKLAQELDIHSIGVVDHWVNYGLRFEREGQKIFPDEIWVSDKQAYSRALSCFPEQTVYQKPNRYLERLVSQINIFSNNEKRRDKTNRVLYVLEPISEQWGSRDISGEFQALDYFLDNMNRVDLDKSAEIRLRPHPSDPSSKYSKWCSKHLGYNISIDAEHSLSELIAWADWIVGCETFAMVIALHVDKRTLSTLPPWAPACALPHNGIIELRELI